MNGYVKGFEYVKGGAFFFVYMLKQLVWYFMLKQLVWYYQIHNILSTGWILYCC